MKYVAVICIGYITQRAVSSIYYHNLLESLWTENQPASEKLRKIWDEFMKTSDSPGIWPTYFQLLRNLNFIPYVPGLNLALLASQVTFRPFSDELKSLHGQGTYAKIRVDWNADGRNSYSGMFSEDSLDHGYITFSKGFRILNQTNFVGLGIKMFRDFGPPAHILGAWNFVGLPNWNIFDYLICNHYNWIMSLPLFPLGPGKRGMGWTMVHNQFGLSHMANMTQDGRPVDDVRFPWGICLNPTAALREQFRGNDAFFYFYDPLQHIPDGTKLYDVIAIKEPIVLEDPDLLDEYSHVIGSIHTESNFINSTYADRRLFIQHQPFEWDLVYRPDWKKYTTPKYLSRVGAPFAYKPLGPDTDIIDGNVEENFLNTANGIKNVLLSLYGGERQLSIFGLYPDQLYNDVVKYLAKVWVRKLYDSDEYAPAIRLTPKYLLDVIKTGKVLIDSVGGKHSSRDTYRSSSSDKTHHINDTADGPFEDVPFLPIDAQDFGPGSESYKLLKQSLSGKSSAKEDL